MMNKKIVATLVLVLVAIAGPMSLAQAQESVTTYSGFVDASYYSNATDETNSFNLDQAEVDIEKKIEGAGGLRIDIQHVNGDEMTADDVLEQGFVWVDLGSDLTFTFGKFNAPIGWELLDPNDMYQFSHAMVFDYGLPTNLTGGMLSGGFGVIDFALYGVNGWDLISDNNKEKTFGIRVGVTPVNGVNIGFSYIAGDEMVDEETNANLKVVDIDLTLTMIDNLTIGAEYNAGVHDGQSVVVAGDDATWTGYLVMVNYAFTDKVALTIRYDGFDDEQGARLGSGMKESRQAFTISPSYAIAEGFGVLAEYRVTTSDEKVFTKANGDSDDTMSEIAIEFTYSF